jgi:hypothetical protein
MPCRLIACFVMLLLWPLVRAWQWFAGTAWWVCLVIPVAVALLLSMLLSLGVWAFRRYSVEGSAMSRKWARFEHALDGAGYGWMILPGTILLGAGGVLAFFHAGVAALPSILPPLALAWLALTDSASPAPIPPDPLPVILDDTPLPDPESGREIIVSWASTLEESAPHESLSLTIPEEEYLEYRQRDRHPERPESNYARYVLDGRSPSVRRLVGALRSYSTQRQLSLLQEATCVIRLVRGIAYESDKKTRNVPNWADYPVELLADQEGDCEDHAILAAALLHELGHQVALYWIELGDVCHLALGYCAEDVRGTTRLQSDDGSSYFYVETVATCPTDGFGDMPNQFLIRLVDAKLIPIPQSRA